MAISLYWEYLYRIVLVFFFCSLFGNLKNYRFVMFPEEMILIEQYANFAHYVYHSRFVRTVPPSVWISSSTIEISLWKRSYLLSNEKTKAKSQQKEQNFKNRFFKLSWCEICTIMELTMLAWVVCLFSSALTISFVAISRNILCISLFSRIFEPIKRKQRDRFNAWVEHIQ